MTTISPDSPDFSAKKKTGRRKIKIEFIDDKSRRQITFSKRKAGLMKKVRTRDLPTTYIVRLVNFQLGLRADDPHGDASAAPRRV